jgi:DNA-binding LacI/PurR family transcriptional regulator
VVGIDNVECGRMAARELIACGYTDVGFLGGPESATSTQDRYTGFASEIARHSGIKLRYSFAKAYSFDAGRDEMERLLKDSSKSAMAQAYFCGDDVLTIGALQRFNMRAKRCRKISV